MHVQEICGWSARPVHCSGNVSCWMALYLARKGPFSVLTPAVGNGRGHGCGCAALMENQVAAMRARGIPCSMLSSAQPAAERAETMRRLQTNPPELSLLLVTPELLATDGCVDHAQGC